MYSGFLDASSGSESGVPSQFQSVNFILELTFTYIELDLDLHSASKRFIYLFILESYL